MENKMDDITDDQVEKLRSVSRRIIIIVSVLVCLGIILVYSASCIRAGRHGADYLFLQKQLLWLLVGACGLFIASRFNFNKLRKFAGPICLIVYGLLGAVLIPGVGSRINGAARWLRFGGYNMQPSEFAKIGMVIAVGAFLASFKSEKLPFFKGFLPAISLVAVACGLIMIEPDFGTAALTGAVLTGMIIVAGARLWHILVLAVFALPPVVFIGLTKFDYIMARINVWLEGEKTGKGYQVWMSKVALGSGGLTGMGLGEGVSKLYYLPEAHTDFIFAIAGQELGLVGTLFILTMFCVFVFEGTRLVRYSPDKFSALCAFGFTAFIGLQAVFNIAVVTASVPPKGISLPFISFGGSGLSSAMVSVGLMLSITRSAIKKRRSEVIDYPYDLQQEFDESQARGVA